MAVAAETFQHLKTAGLADVDPELAELLGRELERQRGQIELIASENFTWPSMLEAVGSVPTNKYAEGYPGRRYYGGCEVVDEIEQTAIDRAMAHFAGLVAAGLHPNPVAHSDFVTSTTHKTLAGPRSGFVLCKEEHATAVDRAVFPGMQGGPLEHTIAAKATCFKIAMTDAFREYQRQVRVNADVLCETLVDGGLDVLTGGTDTHLLQLDLRSTEWTGKAAEERLHEVKVTVNRNTVPFDQHKLSYLRDKDTPTVHFRKLVNEVTLLLTYEATKDLPTEDVEVETPLEVGRFPRISGKKVAVCPILRAGVGMLDGVLSLISSARVGFIGMYRDEETLEPVEYYAKLPADVAERDVILLDPMLATGNSTAAAVETVKKAGATSVRLIAIIAAPEGIDRIHRDHPDVQIVVAAIDRGLNERGYIVPGLGDAGDRLYGTK